MSANFLGGKKLEKFSKKTGVMFISGYMLYGDFTEANRYRIYILKDQQKTEYALLIIQDKKTREREYKLRRLPKGDFDIHIDYKANDLYMYDKPISICLDLTSYLKQNSIYGGIVNQL